MARVVIFLFTLSVFIAFLMNSPQKRQIWSKYCLWAVSGYLSAFVFKNIAAPMAGFILLFCALLALILSIVIIINEIQWLLQRYPNWKGLAMALLNALGSFEVIAISWVPLVGTSGEAGIAMAMGYYPIALATVMGTVAYAVYRYIERKELLLTRLRNR